MASEDPKPLSNTRLIVDFFFGGKATGHMNEIKALNTEEKEQLGQGLRDGSLNY